MQHINEIEKLILQTTENKSGISETLKGKQNLLIE